MGAESVGVLVPVGPGAEEEERLAALLASLFAHEPDTGHVVLVDDGPRERRLAAAVEVPAGCRLTVLANPRAGKGVPTLGGLCCATLAGLRHLALGTEVRFVLRLDTDALVIAPFASRLATAFGERPGVGALGSYETVCNGHVRQFAAWEPALRRLARRVSVWRHPARRGRYLQLAIAGRRARVREELAAALANGYRWGEHCQGGGYALNRLVLDRLAAGGMLDDPLRWRDTRAGEDVMVGVLVRAAGLRLDGHVEPDEGLFAVAHAGLPLPPEHLLRGGYAIVHSVKRTEGWREPELRAAFAHSSRPPAAGRARTATSPRS
ncbi:MAG: hypothetical protein JWN32_2554 [Solirubrobacterales bacterium]|nr:hypothetical protein [Solirubrobacterales bacterium]